MLPSAHAYSGITMQLLPWCKTYGGDAPSTAHDLLNVLLID